MRLPGLAGIPVRVLAGRGDRSLPADVQRCVATEGLGLDPDQIAGGHLVALSYPNGLAERLVRYVAGLVGDTSGSRRYAPTTACDRRWVQRPATRARVETSDRLQGRAAIVSV